MPPKEGMRLSLFLPTLVLSWRLISIYFFVAVLTKQQICGAGAFSVAFSFGTKRTSMVLKVFSHGDSDIDINIDSDESPGDLSKTNILKCAILGCGMMGQEHISYIMGYPRDIQIDYLVDPHIPSLEKASQVWKKYHAQNLKRQTERSMTLVTCGDVVNGNSPLPPAAAPLSLDPPKLLSNEQDLLQVAHDIDLLVLAHPNHLHTASLLLWAPYHHLTILCEKPVAVNMDQYRALGDLLLQSAANGNMARIWVGMEYRYIPAISKLLQILENNNNNNKNDVGEIKMVSIRENRCPFLDKIGQWNRFPHQTGDTLVEKACHFFDLFHLITGKRVATSGIRTLVQRGLNYGDEGIFDKYRYADNQQLIPKDRSSFQAASTASAASATPIIDSAYILLPFQDDDENDIINCNDLSGLYPKWKSQVMGCLELCMYAEGSRHQEEIIVTGTKGRVEAYLPENKVYYFRRPTREEWPDRSEPPPPSAIHKQIFDCNNDSSKHSKSGNIQEVLHGIDRSKEIPTHGGYHFSSTAVEWYFLIQSIRDFQSSGHKLWNPHVSLEDGLRAVEIGIRATQAIESDQK